MIGPQRPPVAGPSRPPRSDDDDDDYAPPLPPSMSKAARDTSAADESDDDVGPMPAPSATREARAGAEDGVAEFEAREAARRRRAEEDARPKPLKRDEWMLVPPTESELLNSMDPTKLKRRGFSQASASAKAAKKDTTLWTETPQERAQRQADEVMGKKRKTENAEVGDADEAARIAEERKRQRDLEMRTQVERHNKSSRAETLVDQHVRTSGTEAAEKIKAQNAVWDRERDMGLGGRLMEEGKRKAIMSDARQLGGKFSSGSYL